MTILMFFAFVYDDNVACVHSGPKPLEKGYFSNILPLKFNVYYLNAIIRHMSVVSGKWSVAAGYSSVPLNSYVALIFITR